MQHSLPLPRLVNSACGTKCRRASHRTPVSFRLGSNQCTAATASLAPLARLQREQARYLDRVIDGMDIDSLAALGFHGADDIRGLVASEAVRSASLVTVPLSSTLAVSMDEDGGQLSILAPPEMPPNVKKAIEVVAGLIRDTPDHQLLILAVLLLWARKYGSTAWREYCTELLPPFRELSCLLCYTPGELSTLQLPHLAEEASRQHDWARWAHSQWLSSSSGALRRLGLAERLEDSMWALAVVRSRAVEFQMGATAGSGSGSGSGFGSNSGFGRARRPPGPIVSVLAPVVDLANHSNDPNCVIQLTTDRSRVVLLPQRPVAAGEPLTVDYGFDRSSLELMTDYGFVASANPYDGEVTLPDADKLAPLDLSRLRSAARSLLRRRQRWRRQQQAVGAAGGGEEEGGEAEGEEAEGGDLGGETWLLAGAGAEEVAQDGDEDDEEAGFSGRLRAAVSLLAPSAAPGGSYSTPATQRIIAGLWHKLVRHCADSLPTSLESDRAMLGDILAGRISGFAMGPEISIDPATPAAAALPTVAAAAASAAAQGGLRAAVPGRGDAARARSAAAGVGAAGAQPTAAAGSAAPATGEVSGGPRGRVGGADGVRDQKQAGSGGEAEGVVEDPLGFGQPGSSGDGTSSGASPEAAEATEALAGSSLAAPPTHGSQGAAVASVVGAAAAARGASSGGAGSGDGAMQAPAANAAAGPGAASSLCRTGRRAGRLYAALRARVEHKQLLQVAEELLGEYGRK
ncbi:hypothetical protein PLESTB_001401600 [Pleodorina starrii]|uniref:SET domain-containing protein n=1 Tax=Pleodorina starrii TaxID=330485 RepID=A0A9W6BVW6_9CHLO|nr:hypothetical protein PLESTM_000531200 [Pleodorina starrii]GLC58792.1 hypothetical protein PLESTB_001401600 [Pleodorina starrii]GLC68725.1 hypothetical protein PLESTF_000728500 [Pleodorina starrii]